MTFDLLKVLLDTEALRRSSPTHGQEQVIELDQKLLQGVFIPAGVAHGFYSGTDAIHNNLGPNLSRFSPFTLYLYPRRCTMLRYLFIPILIVGCVQPAIKRPTTTLPEQDPLQGANRLEHYLSSLNEMCSENPQRISSLIEVGYQDLARIGPREPMLDTVNDLHLIALQVISE